MTYRIAQSVADLYPGGFAVVVAAHAHELRVWREHMGRVESDAASGVLETEAHVAYPRPSASQDVEAAVDERGEPDFEVVYDGPSEQQILDDKKNALTQQIAQAEADAAAAILPPRKHRILGLKSLDVAGRDAERQRKRAATADARSKDLAKVTDAYEKARPGMIKRAAKKLLGIPDESEEKTAFVDTSNEVTALVREAGLPPEAGRSAEDDAFMRDMSEKNERLKAVSRWAAERMHEIEDLTAETVDQWSVPEIKF